MRNIVILICLYRTIFNFSIDLIKEKVYILPEINNFLNPFKFSIPTEEELKASLTLSVSCTEEVKTNFIFEDSYKDICSFTKKEFNVKRAEEFLEGFSIKIDDSTQKLKNLFIDYTLFYSQNGVDKILSCKQTLNKPLFIPIENNNKFIQYKKNKHFENLVLTIDPLYLDSSNISNFELNKYYLFPEWIDYSFQNNNLIFSGNFPNELTENLTLIFYLIDEKSKLSSKMITIWITVPTIFDKTPRSTLLTIIMILLFFMILFGIGIVAYLRNKQKKREESLKNSIDAENQRKQQNFPQTVLTDSIVNWNKKLMLKHKNSLKENTQNTIGSIILTQEKSEFIQNQNYVKFDGDSSFEVNRSQHSLKLNQKLSIIHAPSDYDSEDDKKSSKSGFLDENPFN